MGMQWVRLDVAFPRNHKVLALLAQRNGSNAVVTYVCGLAYAGEQGTNGFIPREALAHIHGSLRNAEALTDAGLWHKQAGGWVVNGWEEFQPSTEEMKQRKVRAEAGAAARWDGHEAMTNAERQRLYRMRKRSMRNGASGNAT